MTSTSSAWSISRPATATSWPSNPSCWAPTRSASATSWPSPGTRRGRATIRPATGVWDVDSIGLIEILARLNRGEDGAGSPIGQRAGFTIACALDPTAADQATEWDRLERKIEAGAHLVMTQPLYDGPQVQAMLVEARRRVGPGGFPVPVLLGVLPLQSSRHAEFLHNEVPGITIPDAIRTRLRVAGDRAADVGLELALELVLAAAPSVAGTYVMPSFGRYEQCAELVRRIRAAIPWRWSRDAV